MAPGMQQGQTNSHQTHQRRWLSETGQSQLSETTFRKVLLPRIEEQAPQGTVAVSRPVARRDYRIPPFLMLIVLYPLPRVIAVCP